MFSNSGFRLPATTITNQQKHYYVMLLGILLRNLAGESIGVRICISKLGCGTFKICRAMLRKWLTKIWDPVLLRIPTN